MSVGGVNPLEWILPPVAISHAIVNTASKAITGKDAVVTPGSAEDKARKAQAAADAQVKASQTLAESRNTEDTSGVQTGQDDYQSRQRALSASSFITGQKRNSGTSSLAYSGAL